MHLTDEQQRIVESTGDIKINAVAGSGKTTTLLAYAKARPKHKRMLYLAFNKSVKTEAIKRFQTAGLPNVSVHTAHSLAYREIVFRHGYEVQSSGYTPQEIARVLGLEGFEQKHAEYILANHIAKFVSYFCNSAAEKVSDLDYTTVVTDKKAKAFVQSMYSVIERQTRLFLAKMNAGEIPITHDFYLKKFQLSKPQLPYDYILFDEAQDASTAMLDVVLRQRATKVLVGDTHQQIYGWRFAINSLQKAAFTSYPLATSFRFGPDVAQLAKHVLHWKQHLGLTPPASLKGAGQPSKVKSKAVIARTNLGLLLKAIAYITAKNPIERIYFEGHLSSYTYAEEGASLYDVLHLQNGRKKYIRDAMIRQMKNMAELEDYIEKTEDLQLGMMVEIVKEYGNRIPNLLKKLKASHVPADKKEEADMVFSTVHRCKGMEYDEVELVNDFMTEEKLTSRIAEAKEEELDVARLSEEVNLLYVALTRAKHKLYLPEALLPKEVPPSKSIEVVKQNANKEKGFRSTPMHYKGEEGLIQTIRKKHKAAYKPWTKAMDKELWSMYMEGYTLKELMAHFERTKGSIRSRINKLDLKEKNGEEI